MPNGPLARVTGVLGKQYLPIATKQAVQAYFPKGITSLARGCNQVSRYYADQFGMSFTEFKPLGSETSLASDAFSALTGGKWKQGSAFDSLLLKDTSAGGAVTQSSLQDFSSLVMSKGGINGGYWVNDPAYVSQNGHLYLYVGALQSLSSDNIGTVQQTWGKNNTIRALFGTFPIGAQELTPQQIQDATQGYTSWYGGTSPMSVDGSIDVFPTTSAIASQQLQLQRWRNQTEVNGTSVLLGRASLVNVSDSTFQFTSDGKLIVRANANTVPGAHPLDGVAGHMLLIDLLNQQWRDVVSGAGTNPLRAIDGLNLPIALNMWYSRGRLFDVFLKNYSSILKSLGSSGDFAFTSDVLKSTMDLLAKESPASARVARWTQVQDTLSPVVSRGSSLARWLEATLGTPTSAEQQGANEVARTGDFDGEGNPAADTDRATTIRDVDQLK